MELSRCLYGGANVQDFNPKEQTLVTENLSGNRDVSVSTDGVTEIFGLVILLLKSEFAPEEYC